MVKIKNSENNKIFIKQTTKIKTTTILNLKILQNSYFNLKQIYIIMFYYLFIITFYIR